MEQVGFVIAVVGLALCMITCGIGSAIGLYKAGTAAAGVCGEDAKKYSKVFVLAVLPATQGIYGFVIVIMGISHLAVDMTVAQGWAVLCAALPMTIVGLASAVFQGITAVNSILAVSKEDSLSGKVLLFPAMVETYAILALVITIMLFGALGF